MTISTEHLAFIICILSIIAITILLIKKYQPQLVLFLAGILLFSCAYMLGLDIPLLEKLRSNGEDSGLFLFDLFALIKYIFGEKSARIGVIIMTIAGFVGYMKQIRASDALVQLCLRPLDLLKEYPYLSSSLLVVLGQFLSMCISSAAGLGLLLMATIYPLLMRLGISRVSAVAVITATTAFDMGPASINTLASADILGVSTVEYFLEEQALVAFAGSIVLALLLYVANKFFDGLDRKKGEEEDHLLQIRSGINLSHPSYGIAKVTKSFFIKKEKHFLLNFAGLREELLVVAEDLYSFSVTKAAVTSLNKEKLTRTRISQKKFYCIDKSLPPLLYGLLPILPIFLLIIFSRFISLFDPPIVLDTSTAMLVSWGISILILFFYEGNAKKIFTDAVVFWTSMGTAFASIVTLIVAAGFFANSLISLGFISTLLDFSQAMGFAFVGISVVMVFLIFMASINLGSGNAVFFAFSPMVPTIAATLGGATVVLLLPMQLAASMGRATSPISAVVLACSQLAHISSFKVFQRNILPMFGTLVFIILLSFFR